MLIVNSNELRHGRTFLDPAGGKSHNDCKGWIATIHEVGSASVLVAPGGVLVRLRCHNSGHQCAYPAHVLPHLPHERDLYGLHGPRRDPHCLAHGHWPREHLPMYSDCPSLGHAHSRHLHHLKASFIGNAVPNVVTDILILSLPVRVVWRLYATSRTICP